MRDRETIGLPDEQEQKDRAEWEKLTAGRYCSEANFLQEPSRDFIESVWRGIRMERRRQAFRKKVFWGMLGALAASLVVVWCFPMMLQERVGRDVVVQGGGKSLQSVGDWLVKQQEEDGTWSPVLIGGRDCYRPAMTALALLMLEREGSGRYGGAVERAERALLRMMREDGTFGTDQAARLYNHAFASYALVRQAGKRGGDLSKKLQKTVRFSEEMCNAYGTWGGADGEIGDATLTVWELGVLAEAKRMGWKDEKGSFRKGLAWVRRRGESGVLDYRTTLGMRKAVSVGGIVLTQMATDSLLRECEGKRLASVVEILETSFAAARDRYRMEGAESVRGWGSEPFLVTF